MSKEQIRRLNKYVEYFETKFKIFSEEKNYFGFGYRLKYILEKNNSDELIIVFSACTRQGIKARYNYNRTLKDVKANKLFILDDFGYDGRGAYYLGHNNDYKIEKLCKRLINELKIKLNVKKTIYVGSSKGGYAALLFGLPDKGSTIIAGAPQYKLGDYLNSEAYRENCLKYIVGEEINDNKIDFLNNLLHKEILSFKDNNNKIYLHYSIEEHTYKEHVKYLLQDLKRESINCNSDIARYKDHGDISLYFPKYLITIINKGNER
jgi:hypothetical protein